MQFLKEKCIKPGKSCIVVVRTVKDFFPINLLAAIFVEWDHRAQD